TWEPEAHLEDCREVLLTYKKNMAEAKAKKEMLPAKSDLFAADSDSDSDKDRPTDLPVKKKKKKVEEPPPTEKKKKKKKKDRRLEDFRPLPAPETDEEELPTSPPATPKIRALESDEEPVPTKKLKKEKAKEVIKQKPKAEEAKKKRGKKELKIDTSDDDTAPIEEDISEGPSETPTEDTSTEPLRNLSIYLDDKFKEKKGKWEVKLQGFKDLIQKKESKNASPKESSLQKLKSLTSKAKEEAAPHSSDSSDSSTAHRKPKSKDRGTVSSVKAKEDKAKEDKVKEDKAREDKVKEDKAREDKAREEKVKEDKAREDTVGQKDAGSTNLFEKFLLNCEAKDRAPRRPATHQLPPEKSSSKPLKVGLEEGVEKATLNLGMDLNLDWMTLEDFQKHLNGDDEVLSGPPLSPSELRDAVKSGDYLAVKLALNSKEDYNLDQEDGSGMTLSMLAAAGGQDDILRLLIRKGVRINRRQKNGTTALMHAAEKNCLTTVAILLEAGAYVNAQTLGGDTALMKACKRGNADVVRLLLEYGADCNIMSKHGKNTAMYFAKLSNNLMVCDLIKDHVGMLSSVTDDAIRAYFESRLLLLEPVFPLACHRLCEGPDFYMEFGYKPGPQPDGSGILLFIFHANFQTEITARLCGPCAVHAVVLNDKFQLPIFLDSHFIYSFSPVPGINKLFIRLAESPTAKVKLLICAYKVQLQ
uniref:M-phase phosphoprotein 8 n=1 Tax=Neogobius melanostomus TaxID=47308 RepID=A0A8C6UEI6_9GOBI